MYWSDSYQ